MVASVLYRYCSSAACNKYLDYPDILIACGLYVRCQRVCLHRVNCAVVITFFYVTVAMHVTSRDVRVIKTPICTIMQHDLQICTNHEEKCPHFY